MKCLFCGMELAPLRALVDGDFCCDQHRQSYQRKQQVRPSEPERQLPMGGVVPMEFTVQSAPEASSRSQDPAVPLACRQEAIQFPQYVATPADGFTQGFLVGCNQLFQLDAPPASAAPEAAREPEAAVHEIFDLKPHLPVMKGDPEFFDLYQLAASKPAAARVEPAIPEIPYPLPQPAQKQAAMALKSLLRVWKHAPSDLRLLTMVLPVLVILAFTPSLPKVRVGVTPDGGIPRALSGQWDSFRHQIADRAAVEYTDDFRSGLDDWLDRNNAAADWSYDAAGFVRPGPLALFKPTLTMSDYRFEFLGEIDQKGMGCVVRAADPYNFYAIKLSVVKPGPLPEIRLVRYAMVNGKEGPKVERPLPILARTDTVYRILVDVHGDDFTIMTQGKLVDSWSDSRLKRGGVGLFCARGEKARVRWVEVTHQYDALGKLCAYLAPYGPGRTGLIE